jgi:polyhydroxyalkanoate synthesis regulator phasin
MAKSSDFLYPRSRYYGKVNPENLVFNANLQEFAQQVSYICNLETSGKISPEEAYQKVRDLWKQLKRTKKQLGIGESPFQIDDGKDEI